MNVPVSYQFNKKVKDHMDEKFAEILGIEPWMWLTLGSQIVLEGYGVVSFLFFFSYITLTCIYL